MIQKDLSERSDKTRKGIRMWHVTLDVRHLRRLNVAGSPRDSDELQTSLHTEAFHFVSRSKVGCGRGGRE